VAGLEVDRIDPKEEIRRYVEHVLATTGAGLDADARSLLEEDLRSPCTEEIAVFSAFSHLLREARRKFVVLDTAPTGHTLLLLDATGAYHRDVMRKVSAAGPASGRLKTPLDLLRDPAYTHVVLVALPQSTRSPKPSACRRTCAVPASSRGPGCSTGASPRPRSPTRCSAGSPTRASPHRARPRPAGASPGRRFLAGSGAGRYRSSGAPVEPHAVAAPQGAPA